MPATGREFTRRAVLLAALASRLRADSADQVWELIGAMASALSRDSASDFVSAFDRAMPGFEDFRSNVTALLAQSEVQSSIDLVSNEGDDQKRSVEVDWLLRITVRDSVSGVVKREERVKCGVEKKGKGWRIVSFEPRTLFAPPRSK